MHLIILRVFGLIKLKNWANKSKIINYLYSYVISSHTAYIGKDAYFKSPPHLLHGIKGIFISGGSVIGKNVTIFQNVTIGSNTLIDSKNRGAPEIGDECYIGAGAKIIGNIEIGRNCRIGANAVVVDGIAPNSVVVCGKSIVIERETKMDNTFYLKKGANWAKLINWKGSSRK